MHPILSIKNRFIRPWQRENFEKTAMGKHIAQYKDKHKGERCFIIGNGPSLSAEDLQVLHENNVVTFASNRIYHIFDKTSWRPTYYVSEDLTILQGIQNEIPHISCEDKFIPVNHKWDNAINIPEVSYFYLDYKSEFSETFGLSLDSAKAIRCRGTVTVTCIQLAIYMGFKDIYLLGVDHNYSKYIDSDGNIVEDNTVKDYFSAEYDTDFKNIISRDLGGTTLSYISVEKLSKKLGTFNIYNATRGGKLEVFRRVNFDSLF